MYIPKSQKDPQRWAFPRCEHLSQHDLRYSQSELSGEKQGSFKRHGN